jgi:hypothetical protein
VKSIILSEEVLKDTFLKITKDLPTKQERELMRVKTYYYLSHQFLKVNLKVKSKMFIVVAWIHLYEFIFRSDASEFQNDIDFVDSLIWIAKEFVKDYKYLSEDMKTFTAFRDSVLIQLRSCFIFIFGEIGVELNLKLSKMKDIFEVSSL